MLIDKTYFIGEINIPDGKYSDLDTFIERFEKEFIIQAFGYTLAKEILAYDSAHHGNSSQRILDIINGKEFDELPYKFKWTGLINADKISPIAYYVYCQYMRSKITHTGTTGESGNGTDPQAETNIKVQNAWAQMLTLIGEGSYTGMAHDNSLHYFMTKHISDYPEWLYTDFGFVNAFDL